MSDQSTDTALREMSRSIGGLESTVKLMVSTWQQQEASASQGRRDLHSKFDTLAEKVSGLGSKVDTAVKDINEIKPSVQAFETAKEQARGAQKLGKWIWAVLTLSGGAIGWMLANWITIGPKLH
jgi:outer membrane murein-binding lipoprotein Lpp